MVVNKESTPPPVIGKAGRYTVFLTPPATPKPSSDSPKSGSPTKFDSSPKVQSSPTKFVQPVQTHTSTTKLAPPVQPPPQQFEKPSSGRSLSDSSAFGFFWNAVSKVQDAHSSLDEYLADWFGLNHSKYQWALDDYYESQGKGKGDAKLKEQNV